MDIIQLSNQPVNITEWFKHEEFSPYPEGARDKTKLYCPTPSPYPFLKADHQYLFKRSSDKYPEQFWVEVLAYRLGRQMTVSVPPAFVAYDRNENQSAALIEWFLVPRERSMPGGDYCQRYIPDFDRKKGKQHNFETVLQIFNGLQIANPTVNIAWKTYWAKTFLFDALIGNTDRHQDNWEIIESFELIDGQIPNLKKIRISPVFDNGTSMGHEIRAIDFQKYDDKNTLERYVLKGTHHMKWSLSDVTCMKRGVKHDEMLAKFIELYPETCQIMLDCLYKVSDEFFKKVLGELVEFNVPVKLSTERANFMLKLLTRRHQHLLHQLEK